MLALHRVRTVPSPRASGTIEALHREETVPVPTISGSHDIALGSGDTVVRKTTIVSLTLLRRTASALLAVAATGCST